MSTRQLSIGDFAAHCLEEVKAIQEGDTVLEILSSGKVVAVLSPPAMERLVGGLGDWMGGGEGLMAYAPGYVPEEPAFAPEDWGEFQEHSK